MAFKDNLREFIGNLGGFGPENLTRLQGLVRSDVPDFTTIRLSALLQGSPPRTIEVAGLAKALDVHPRQLLNESAKVGADEGRKIADFAVGSLKNFQLVESFCVYVETSAAFRGKALTQNDLSEILNAFRPESELEDEMELFDLGDQ